jgi:predicted DNA-binding transcriptional regulator YafY
MTPPDRWPAILLHLQGDTWQRATDLAAALGVSERTIYRDMHALDEAGVPLRAVPGKGYRLRDDYLMAPVALTTDEATMLLVGSAQAASHVEGRYRAAAHAARTKLAERLSDADREKAGALLSSMRLVSERAFGRTAADQTLRLLRRALVDGRTIRFEEHRSGRTVQHTMNPYGLVHRATAWHVVGYDHDAARVRHVRVDQIQAPSLLNTTFERPDGYRAALGGDALPDQTVRVLFAADVASSVQAAPSLHVVSTDHRPDGRLLMALRVHHEREVLPWLLSWGADAYVVEPEALRRRLAQEAQRMAARYRDAPTLME